jgi:hypothetical protein
MPAADAPLAQLVHEMRDRLTAVKGAWATLLLFDEQLHPDVRSELMEMVTRNIDRAGLLVDEFLPTVAWPPSSTPPRPLSGFDGLIGVGQAEAPTDSETLRP